MDSHALEVHPCAELFSEMTAKLGDDDFYQMKILSKDQLGVQDIDSVERHSFCKILHDKFGRKYEELLMFLEDVAQHTGKTKNLEEYISLF